MNMTNYFDLEQVWVHELVGDIWLFVFVGIILIWLVCLKAKTPFQIPSLLTVIWAAICFSISYRDLLILWFFAIFIAAFIFYYVMNRILK